MWTNSEYFLKTQKVKEIDFSVASLANLKRHGAVVQIYLKTAAFVA